MSYFSNKQSRKEFRKELRANLTEEEKILWVQLWKNKLGVKFRRQYSIGNYIADFYCIEKKLVIELDGAQHLDNQEYDSERDSFLKSQGCTVLRFWNNEIPKSLDGVIMKILDTLESL